MLVEVITLYPYSDQPLVTAPEQYGKCNRIGRLQLQWTIGSMVMHQNSNLSNAPVEKLISMVANHTTLAQLPGVGDTVNHLNQSQIIDNYTVTKPW